MSLQAPTSHGIHSKSSKSLNMEGLLWAIPDIPDEMVEGFRTLEVGAISRDSCGPWGQGHLPFLKSFIFEACKKAALLSLLNDEMSVSSAFQSEMSPALNSRWNFWSYMDKWREALPFKRLCIFAGCTFNPRITTRILTLSQALEPFGSRPWLDFRCRMVWFSMCLRFGDGEQATWWGSETSDPWINWNSWHEKATFEAILQGLEGRKSGWRWLSRCHGRQVATKKGGQGKIHIASIGWWWPSWCSP